MREQMYLERGLDGERFLADGTPVHLLAVVEDRVARQVLLPDERLITRIALVALLALVHVLNVHSAGRAADGGEAESVEIGKQVTDGGAGAVRSGRQAGVRAATGAVMPANHCRHRSQGRVKIRGRVGFKQAVW